MLRLALLLIVALRAVALEPAVMVVPFTPDIVDNADARDCFARLLALGGYGRRGAERAAFLVWQAEDRYQCVIWPANNGWQTANWRGPWPENTAAVVHTHPLRLPHPSVQDALEAQRLSIPILVVTPEQLTLVRNPADPPQVLAHGSRWWH